MIVWWHIDICLKTHSIPSASTLFDNARNKSVYLFNFHSWTVVVLPGNSGLRKNFLMDMIKFTKASELIWNMGFFKLYLKGITVRTVDPLLTPVVTRNLTFSHFWTTQIIECCVMGATPMFFILKTILWGFLVLFAKIWNWLHGKNWIFAYLTAVLICILEYWIFPTGVKWQIMG